MANNPSQWKKHSAIVALKVENATERRGSSNEDKVGEQSLLAGSVQQL